MDWAKVGKASTAAFRGRAEQCPKTESIYQTAGAKSLTYVAEFLTYVA
jgi:hypothetical protein